MRRVLAGIRRHRGLVPARRRTALRPAHIAAVLAAMDPEQQLAAARDTVLFLIGWKAALRADDLHRLDMADLRLEDTTGAHAVGEGPGLAVRLRRSKTDQAGQTVTVGSTATPPRPDGTGDPLDAVAAWTRWHGEHDGTFRSHPDPAPRPSSPRLEDRLTPRPPARWTPVFSR